MSRTNTRPASNPKRAFDTLLDEAVLAEVIRRARWLNILGHHLHTRLPSPLNLHARLANVQDDALIYLVDSPIWHTRLRLSSESLLDAARGLGVKVTTLRIRTARQPFDPQVRAMAAIDARMRYENGTRPVETLTLAEIRASLSALLPGEGEV